MKKITKQLLLPTAVSEAMNILRNAGFQAFLVGGAVRDLLLGRTPKDYDLTTDATPDQIESVFPHTYPSGKKYGTITVLIDGFVQEITTFRFDGEYTDGRRPNQVTFSTNVEEDVTRRDATINAILYDGKDVIDYIGGVDDLLKGTVRAIGNPDQRIQEDALRMLRYIRIASQLGFSIEPKTFAAIKKNVEKIAVISQERIRDEIFKILLIDSPLLPTAYAQLLASGLFHLVLPELAPAVGFEQHNPHHNRDVMGHTLEVIKNVRPEITLRLAALFHDCAKPHTFSRDADGIGHFFGHAGSSAAIAQNVLRRFGCSTELSDQITGLVREHMSIPDPANKASIRRLLGRLGEQGVSDLLELIKADRPGYSTESVLNLVRNSIKEIIEEGHAISLRHLAITGRDLISAGLKPGPSMGEVLQGLLNAVIEQPHLNERETLLALASA